ncbi:MAG: ATP-binding cassette domain-containing protein [Clostridiales bacterium]|nr:ATP-binding cassette domain-containing protein [Clostridiales bacterium]
MIELKNVEKHFKKPIRGKGVFGMLKTLFSNKHTVVKAVDGVSFTVEDGEAVGYIGANGAGKSTTIKMMSGILTPTNGEILIDGLHPYKSKERNAVLKTIGVVFGQKTQLWYDLPLTETYDLLRYIYDVSESDYKRRLGELVELLDMKSFLDAPVRTLSLGQRMRADLAAAMLHNPKTLFLDEPTIGLDVLVKRNLIEAINAIRNEYNTTLILTTHAMSDIELLCKRVIILDAGKVLYDGTLDEVKHMFGDKRDITVITKSPLDPALVESKFTVDRVTGENDGLLTTITIDASKIHAGEILNYLLTEFEVDDVKIAETGIEKVVEKIYEKNGLTIDGVKAEGESAAEAKDNERETGEAKDSGGQD